MKVIKEMRKLVYLLLAMIAAGCASTRIVEVPVETVRTEIEKEYVRDSIFICDSVDRYVKGDTVYIYKREYKIIERIRVDTIVRCDTIPIVQTIEVEKRVNELYWWQESLMWLGVLALGFILIKLWK